MATINSQRQGGMTASVDCSAKQYYLVANSGVRTVAPGTAGALCLGVLENKPPAGQAASILVGPEVKVVLSATLAAGAKYASAADGRAQAAATGNYIMGQLVEGGVANDIVAATFEPSGIAP